MALFDVTLKRYFCKNIPQIFPIFKNLTFLEILQSFFLKILLIILAAKTIYFQCDFASNLPF